MGCCADMLACLRGAWQCCGLHGVGWLPVQSPLSDIIMAEQSRTSCISCGMWLLLPQHQLHSSSLPVAAWMPLSDDPSQSA